MSTLREHFDRYASQGQSGATFTSSTNQTFQSGSSGQQASQQNASFVIPQGGLSQSQLSNATLQWASELNNGFVISGLSDYSRISQLRNAILELRSNYFSANSGLSVQGPQRDDLDRRFLLIEHEIDAILKRRIELSSKDETGASRSLDFTLLLN